MNHYSPSCAQRLSGLPGRDGRQLCQHSGSRLDVIEGEGPQMTFAMAVLMVRYANHMDRSWDGGRQFVERGGRWKRMKVRPAR